MSNYPKTFRRAVALPLLACAGVLLAGVSCSLGGGSRRADGGVFKSTDAGSTWQQVVFVSQGKKTAVTIANLDVARLLVSPVDPETLYALAGGEGVVMTENGGQSWRQLYKGSVSGLGLAARAKGTLFLATGNRLLKTADGGANWQNAYLENAPGVSFTDVAIDPQNVKHVLATGSRGGLLESVDGGVSWQLRYSFPEGPARVIFNPRNVSVLYVPLPSGTLWRSADAGKTWVNVTPSLPGEKRFKTGPFLAFTFIPQRLDALFYATSYGLWRTNDAAATWQSQKLVTTASSVAITGVTVDATHEQNFAYVAGGSLYRTDDNGERWETVQLPSGRLPTALVASSPNAKTIYLGVTKPKQK